MTATAHFVRTASLHIPAWLVQAVLIAALGLALWALRESDVAAPDVILPLRPIV